MGLGRVLFNDGAEQVVNRFIGDYGQLDTSYLALAIGLLARTGRPVTKIPLTKGRWLGKKFPDHLAKAYCNFCFKCMKILRNRKLLCVKQF